MSVAVFSTDGCPHCSKAKAILGKHGIQFDELNLSDFPELRKPMVQLAQSLTVPQIFFNGEHIGGANDLQSLDEAGLVKSRLAEAVNPPSAEIMALLKKPTGMPKPAPKLSPRTEGTYIGPKKEMSAVQVVLEIGKSMRGTTFTGAQLTRWTKSTFGFSSETNAATVALAQAFAENGLVVQANTKVGYLSGGSGEKYVVLTPDAFQKASFCLVRHRRRTALNLFRRWNDRVDPANLVVLALKKQLNAILARHRDDQGLVNYVAVSMDEEFPAFEEATTELQGITLSGLDDDTRLAFVMNVYNLLTPHAFARLGVPTTDLQRLDFFGNNGYDIGGEFWTFNALENGVLRTNKSPPFHLAKTIKKKNIKRIKAVMPTMYPQIHACISCGARSCPPIKAFSVEAVHEEMDLAASAFFEDSANCHIDLEEKQVTLTQIVSWYKSDFGSSNVQVLKTIRKWLTGEKAALMDKLLSDQDGKDVKIGYAHYDWSTDSSHAKSYQRYQTVAGILCSLL